MRDYPLIRKVRDHIVANPDEHNQDQWGIRTPCGTTHCVAGHAVALAGANLLWQKSGDGDVYRLRSAEYGGGKHDIENLAAHILGLTCRESDALFFLFDEVEALNMLDRLLEEEA